MSWKLPKSVNVCGTDYACKLVKKMRGGECRSVMNGDKKNELRFSKKLFKSITPEAQNAYFLHEVKHAQQFETGLIQTLNSQGIEFDADSFASLVRSLKKQGVL